MSEAAIPARPRAWRLQFSLRLLLVAFTAFAIGFPIWYRWPYRERIDNPAGASLITTWQRQWGGGRVKHGMERLIAYDEVVESTMYRNGLRHGPFQGQGIRGQYADDLREGTWTEEFRTSTWHRGKLDGPMEIVPVPASQLGPLIQPRRELRTIRLLFTSGRLMQLDGKPVASTPNSAATRLFNLHEVRNVGNRTVSELDSLTEGDFVEQPLKDVVIYLSEFHAIPFALDRKLGRDCDVPITGTYMGIDLRSALFLIGVQHNLGCDYRYGSLWITTADDANDWHDPTGISEMKPPSGSALARAWNEPVAVDCDHAKFLEAIEFLEARMAIAIDTSRIKTMEQRPPFPDPGKIPGYTPTLRGRALRDVLGHLLYNVGCRCKLDGEALVILPPEETPD